MYTYTYTYSLVPSTGKTSKLSANNCQEIKEALSTDCTKSPQSGIYWVQKQQVCMHVQMYNQITIQLTPLVSLLLLVYKNIVYTHIICTG